DYRRLSTRLVAERAEGVTARHLRLPDGAPILRAIGINVDAEGVPVEFGTSRFAADRVELLVEEGGFA
ncbi:MAG: UTRA domain-containing protein, partial [Pseudomonadota bacterium]